MSLLTLRGLTIDPPLLLAPMAGLTHTVLRRLVLGFGGAGLLSTEMLGATRLPHENPAISSFLVRGDEEWPLSYQVLLNRVEDVAPAFAALHRFGADAIDLNLGCPAPTVRRLGGGSRLAEQPNMVGRLVAEARKRTDLPLTVKIRLGERLDGHCLRDFCRMLEGEGVDLITVHARLRGESFNRPPRWDWVARVKSWVAVPVVANGGILSVADARQCLEISGADGLMIGRAAAQRPWLFAEIAREVYGRGTGPEEISLPRLYLRFIELLEESFRPERRLGRLKEFTHYFAANYAFGHRLASAVQASQTLDQAGLAADSFFARNEAG